MPSTSMLFRRNETAAVEITALAAGAGPPANKMPRGECSIPGAAAGTTCCSWRISLPSVG